MPSRTLLLVVLLGGLCCCTALPPPETEAKKPVKPVLPPEVPPYFTDADDGPSVVERIVPRFPDEARDRGIEGQVRVRFDVDTSGATFNLRIIESDPPGVFDEAVMEAIGGWILQVLLVDGLPQVQRDIEYPVHFRIN